jgi:hypothetical protein
MRHLTNCFISCCAVVVVGCASYGKDFDISLFSHFKSGVTTKAEMISRVGQPSTQMSLGNGQTALTWTFTHSSIGASVKSKHAMAYFDKEDKLLRVTTSESTH